MGKPISNLLALMFKFQNSWILTGAGISTESGIPDFRSPGTGLWEKLDPMEFSSVEGLLRNPKAFFTYGKENIANVLQAQPNTGHTVLGNLQKLGLIGPIVTQNIDDLHRRGGAYHFYEVHGHFRTASCMHCRNQVPISVLMNKVERGEIPPVCGYCGSILKPDVVLFGDMMPPDYQEASVLAHVYQTIPQLIIVIGSSLTVSPINFLPLEFQRIAIINNTPTDTDHRAELVIRKQIGQVMGHLWQEILDLNEGVPPHPLPYGFLFGNIIAYLDNETRFLEKQKERLTTSLDSLSKHVGLVLADLKVAQRILSQCPMENRQALEKAMLNYYHEELSRMETEMGSLISATAITPQEEKSRIPKLLQDNFNENLQALTTYAQQKDPLTEVTEVMAARAAGSFGFWAFAQKSLGLAEPPNGDWKKLQKVARESGVKSDLAPYRELN